MDLLTTDGWGAPLMIAIVGWSALMLLLVYLLSKLWRRRPSNPSPLTPHADNQTKSEES